MQFFEPKTSLAGERTVRTGITGTGADAPTKRYGQGITVSRTAQGVYKYTFPDNPGTLVGWAPGLGADTPADVKGYSVVRGALTSSSGVYSVSVSVFDSSFAAVDLAAAQYLDASFTFCVNSAAG